MKRFLLVIALGLPSCATPGFDKAWKTSLAAPAPGDPVTGPWVGEWTSGANGHSGDLRAIVKRQDEETLDFRYRATWGGWMKGTFRTEGDARRREDGTLEVTGSKRLWPWGTYSHTAVIGDDSISAEFRSVKKNVGTFHLTRPEGH